MKNRPLSESELLQDGTRAAVRRQKLQQASRRYTTELAAEVGEPGPRQRALAQRIARRAARNAS